MEIRAEERDACVMFLDIRDFSRIVADRMPAEVMDYLNTTVRGVHRRGQ